jgi:membrane fusion protein (multidrug efflux system)
MKLTSKRKILSGLGLLSTIFILVAAALWLHHRLTHVVETDAHVDGEEIAIASRLPGWIVKRPVDEGYVIKKGDLLVEIDQRESRAKLKEIDAQIAHIDAQIVQTTAEMAMTKGTTNASFEGMRHRLLEAEATLSRSISDLALAHEDFLRADQLVKKRFYSQQQWDHAHTTYLERLEEKKQAEAALNAARADLARASSERDQVLVLSRQIDVLRKQRDIAQAQRETQLLDLQDRQILSPIDGVVDVTFAEEGDYAQAGQWLMMVHDPSVVWVEAIVKETAVGKVRVGQKATLHVDAYPNETFIGRVIKVGNAATNQFALLPDPNPSGNFTKIAQRVPVRIAVAQKDGLLKPGLMVVVDIDVHD